MGPIVGIALDTRKPDADINRVRRLRQEIRSVQRCYMGDYYPLTPYSKEATVWAVLQFNLADSGEGVIHAFRRKTCPESAITVKLRGLDPQARYTLTDMDGGQPRTLAGRELLDSGLKLDAERPQTALLFTYQRQP